MNDRIHRVLDGDLPSGALIPDERARAEALARVLDRAAAPLRGAPAPDLASRVMAALPAAAPRRTPWQRAVRWLWTPRPIRLRPAYALGGGLCAAALAAVAVPAAMDRDQAPVAAVQAPIDRPASGEPLVYVQFRLETSARQVALAGSFTGWQPTLVLRQTEPGVWTALVPLRAGVHDYVFVVDGKKWVADPHAPQVDDSFGGTNSRISLPPVSASA
ncbi:MAG TPA: glycogen-binding domain-containing protein [Longimicrobium sp.]|uniref:glycogen-binding domain-containing protein n=1 Tax=Longimicrobium sp. TaxID=2029185 RepID=UPI002ED832B4